MHYLFLNSDSEESLFAQLIQSGILDSTSHLPTDATRINVDILGTLFERTGLRLLTEEGETFPYVRPLHGYYAVISGHLSEAELRALPIVERPKELIHCTF